MSRPRREITVRLELTTEGVSSRIVSRGEDRDAHLASFAELGQLDTRFRSPEALSSFCEILARGDERQLERELGNLARVGEVLFAMLYKDNRGWRAAAGVAHGNPHDEPVRQRILTNDPKLMSLPWVATHHEGRSLIDRGWTFELSEALSFDDAGFTELPFIVVYAPLDDPALKSLEHVAQLQQAMSEISTEYGEGDRLRVVYDLAGLKAALPGSHVLYYFGHGVIQNEQVCLAPDGDVISLADLALQFEGASPPVIYLAACMSGAGGWYSAGHQLTESKVVVSYLTSAFTPNAKAEAIRFLEGIAEGADPVKLVASRRVDFQWATRTIHTSYRNWTSNSARFGERRIGLRLDRASQRATAFERITRLTQHQQRRVEGLIAVAPPGEGLRILVDQFRDFMDGCSQHLPPYRVLKTPIPDADSADFLKTAKDRLRQVLGRDAGPGSGRDWRSLFEIAVRGLARIGESPVIILDWGVLPIARPEQARRIVEWAEFQADLASNCGDVRVASCLCLEVDAAVEASVTGQITTVAKTIRGQIRITLIPRPEPIREDEIIEYLEEHAKCPPHRVTAIASLLYAESHGRFDDLVRRIALLRENEWIARS